MSETVKFTLDGAEVEGHAGESIWDVANGRGLVIPHLCHKPAPGYRPDGNCRACMVEIEGERTLAASCIRQPTEGMLALYLDHARSAVAIGPVTGRGLVAQMRNNKA
ncbi:MAG: (2Fe-2S)-binding protein, partial [Pseudomonadota bacterium]